MGTGPKVLLGIGGGIAAYKGIEVVRRLTAEGAGVRCALSRSAVSFVSPLTLEVLSGHAVYQQEYLTATGSGEESHIAAAQWADIFAVVPATAHLLARFALGLADDFLTTTALAFDGPMLVAPAMHAVMWRQPSVQAHVETLRGRGVSIIGPEEGPLASGEWGIGRMTSPEGIVEAMSSLIRSPSYSLDPLRNGSGSLQGKRVLVTAGPTHEPIDPVRFLGNRSSGKMGFALAAEASRRGAQTRLVAGPVSLETPPGVERIDVATALEMQAAVGELAPQQDLIIMTAAVADFRPERRAQHKIKKGDGVPELVLVPNPDILSGLEGVAPGAIRVGFAAETEPSETEALAKLERKRAHFLIWNDVSRRDVGFESDHNEVRVYRPGQPPTFLPRQTKAELAKCLFDLFSEALEQKEDNVATVVG